MDQINQTKIRVPDRFVAKYVIEDAPQSRVSSPHTLPSKEHLRYSCTLYSIFNVRNLGLEPLNDYLDKQLLIDTAERFDQTALIPATAADGNLYVVSLGTNRIYDAVADRTIPQDPNLPNDQEFVNELELIGQQVASGESTVDQVAENVQALIERLAVK